MIFAFVLEMARAPILERVAISQLFVCVGRVNFAVAAYNFKCVITYIYIDIFMRM